MSELTQTQMLNAIAAHLSDEEGDPVLLDAVEIRLIAAFGAGSHVPRHVFHWSKNERSALLVAAPFNTPGASDPVSVRSYLNGAPQ